MLVAVGHRQALQVMEMMAVAIQEGLPQQEVGLVPMVQQMDIMTEAQDSPREVAEAVEAMGRSQLGRSLTAQEIDSIVAFLRTLTGEYQGRPLLPASDRPP
jgi:hypothetical protein